MNWYFVRTQHIEVRMRMRMSFKLFFLDLYELIDLVILAEIDGMKQFLVFVLCVGAMTSVAARTSKCHEGVSSAETEMGAFMELLQPNHGIIDVLVIFVVQPTAHVLIGHYLRIIVHALGSRVRQNVIDGIAHSVLEPDAVACSCSRVAIHGVVDRVTAFHCDSAIRCC